MLNSHISPMSAGQNQSEQQLDERQLCTSCTEPNVVDAHFCQRCGAPLSPFAMITPFERLFAEGFIYRRAAEEPRRLITVLGIWVLFGIPGLTCLTFATIGLAGSPDLAGAAMLGLMPLFSLAIIWKTMRNYLHRKKKPVIQEET